MPSVFAHMEAPLPSARPPHERSDQRYRTSAFENPATPFPKTENPAAEEVCCGGHDTREAGTEDRR